MSTTVAPRLITGTANKPLARAIAQQLVIQKGEAGMPPLPLQMVDPSAVPSDPGLVRARVERFKDQEIFVEIYDNVRGEDMFIIQSTSPPASDNLMELLIMADALRRSSAQRITAVIPYFGYARQDRRLKARTPISAKLVANMLTTAGISRILTMDLHSAPIQGFFDIPVDNLYASPVFALDIKHRFKDSLHSIAVVSPDVGGVARARELAERIDAPLAIVDKRREHPGEVAEMRVIGSVQGKRCLIVDDICDTAGTLCKAASVLLEQGALEVHAYITHGVLSGPAIRRIAESALTSLVIIDSIQPTSAVAAATKIRVLPAAPIFAHAILSIWNGASVSSLFRTETLEGIYDGMIEYAPPRACA